MTSYPGVSTAAFWDFCIYKMRRPNDVGLCLLFCSVDIFTEALRAGLLLLVHAHYARCTMQCTLMHYAMYTNTLCNVLAMTLP